MLPKSWKKNHSKVELSNQPAKMRFCNECNDKILCDGCKGQTNENKEFEANLNLLKR